MFLVPNNTIYFYEVFKVIEQGKSGHEGQRDQKSQETSVSWQAYFSSFLLELQVKGESVGDGASQTREPHDNHHSRPQCF